MSLTRSTAFRSPPSATSQLPSPEAFSGGVKEGDTEGGGRGEGRRGATVEGTEAGRQGREGRRERGGSSERWARRKNLRRCCVCHVSPWAPLSLYVRSTYESRIRILHQEGASPKIDQALARLLTKTTYHGHPKAKQTRRSRAKTPMHHRYPELESLTSLTLGRVASKSQDVLNPCLPGLVERSLDFLNLFCCIFGCMC